ncbi:hypothetical protein [uncultured Cohaesibacter sp.]|uniref:hypothetical protein n=1 Tax=uncultured Cohaesibacter sp. TaxID=1002546 RepID=UPI0029C73FEF|nr:hypothetical protein [uncultured Cohaesibacter sp.]
MKFLKKILFSRSVSSLTKGLEKTMTRLTALADEKMAEVMEIDDTIEALENNRKDALHERVRAKKVAANIADILSV